MTIELLFYTQLGSIIVFVLALFVLYRVLVSQKDATIQLLKEKADYLSQKLSHCEGQKPDVLTKLLSERVENLDKEIERLSTDKQANQKLISEKENELKKTKEDANELSRQISNAHELMEEYFCPRCKAPMAEREYHSTSVEHLGRDVDIDHEYVSFECGLTILDGKEFGTCQKHNERPESSAR